MYGSKKRGRRPSSEPFNNRKRKKRKIDLISPQNIHEQFKSSLSYKTRRNFDFVTPWIMKTFYPDFPNYLLYLKHWLPSKSSVFPDYSILNKGISIVRYSDEEYNYISKFLNSKLSKIQTDELFEMCEKYDLRFPVIQDRLSYYETIEQLQNRYYSLSQALLFIRSGGVLDNCVGHPIMKKPYDFFKSKERKVVLNKFYERPIFFDNLEKRINEELSNIKYEKKKKEGRIRKKNSEIRFEKSKGKINLKNFIIDNRNKILLKLYQKTNVDNNGKEKNENVQNDVVMKDNQQNIVTPPNSSVKSDLNVQKGDSLSNTQTIVEKNAKVNKSNQCLPKNDLKLPTNFDKMQFSNIRRNVCEVFVRSNIIDVFSDNEKDVENFLSNEKGLDTSSFSMFSSKIHEEMYNLKKRVMDNFKKL